jgi:hypothetical protein
MRTTTNTPTGHYAALGQQQDSSACYVHRVFADHMDTQDCEHSPIHKQGPVYIAAPPAASLGCTLFMSVFVHLCVNNSLSFHNMRIMFSIHHNTQREYSEQGCVCDHRRHMIEDP